MVVYKKKVLAKWHENGLWYPGYLVSDQVNDIVEFLDGDKQYNTKSEDLLDLPRTWDWSPFRRSEDRGLLLLNTMISSLVDYYQFQGNEATWDVFANGLVDVKNCLEKPVKTWDEFFERYVWVVYTSGFRVAIVDSRWDKISKDWEGFCLEKVVDRGPVSDELFANFAIRHQQKRKAIYKTAEYLLQSKQKDNDIAKFIETKSKGELAKWLMDFGYIGVTTVNHLMRNLGIDVFKPDRHVCRVGERLNIHNAIPGFNTKNPSDVIYVQDSWSKALGAPKVNDKFDIRRPAFADVVIYSFGKEICQSKPKCENCNIQICLYRDG